MRQIAKNVIRILGGPKVVATAAGVDVTRVYRWTYSKERGGTGGLVPVEHQQTLLDYARNNAIDLTPADFFDSPAQDAAA